MVRTLTLLLWTSTLLGCVTLQERAERSIGYDIQEVMRILGPPTQTFPDRSGSLGPGITIYSYRIPQSRTIPGQTIVSPTYHQGTAHTTANVYGMGNSAFGTATTTYSGTTTGGNVTYVPPQVQTWEALRTFWVRPNGRIIQAQWQNNGIYVDFPPRADGPSYLHFASDFTLTQYVFLDGTLLGTVSPGSQSTWGISSGRHTLVCSKNLLHWNDPSSMRHEFSLSRGGTYVYRIWPQN